MLYQLSYTPIERLPYSVSHVTSRNTQRFQMGVEMVLHHRRQLEAEELHHPRRGELVAGHVEIDDAVGQSAQAAVHDAGLVFGLAAAVALIGLDALHEDRDVVVGVEQVPPLLCICSSAHRPRP